MNSAVYAERDSNANQWRNEEQRCKPPPSSQANSLELWYSAVHASPRSSYHTREHTPWKSSQANSLELQPPAVLPQRWVYWSQQRMCSAVQAESFPPQSLRNSGEHLRRRTPPIARPDARLTWLWMAPCIRAHHAYQTGTNCSCGGTRGYEGKPGYQACPHDTRREN
jgi:hypothetical protein